MLPEERAREKIDKQLTTAGWDIVSRDEYVPQSASAVKEALMLGNTESDYLLFVDDKAIAVVEAKREENPLGEEVQQQAEDYACNPQDWYGLWFPGQIPLVYLANGRKIYFKNMLQPDSDYIELSEMHSPKKMLQLIGQVSEYGALPRLEKRGLRDCQYRAETEFEKSIKNGKKKSLAILATGSGKTYLACLASYRLLNYTPARRILFLVDRNNLARQTESEFSTFDRTEGQQEMSSLYEIKRLKQDKDIKADIVISTIQKLFAVLTGNPIPSDTDEDTEDEKNTADEEKEDTKVIQLGDDLKLPPDYFQLIIVDAYGIIGLNSKDSANKGFLKLSPILFSPQMRLMIDLRRKYAQNEDLSAKRSAACNSGSTVSDVVPSRLLQRQSAEHTPDVDLHRSTVRYSKEELNLWHFFRAQSEYCRHS